VEGSNLGVDYRWAPDDAVLVWKFAKELVELRPDAIVARSTPVVATLLSSKVDNKRLPGMPERSASGIASGSVVAPARGFPQ
jgi:hypothetical protein